ncbi:MAG: DUF488 domain-containing protein [Chloroflexi bacterium]|nr:DUF488 domain-containing protein [Chloroflexota bacterium]
MRLMTCGYQGATPSQFFSTLQKNKVETIVDVRELPLSRKPGFSKSALAKTAARYGIRYTHVPSLGCPRDIRHAYRKDKDWRLFTKRFLAYLKTQKQALNALAELVERERCCLLCFEADPKACHRSFIADNLAGRAGTKLSIVHLTVPSSVRPASR